MTKDKDSKNKMKDPASFIRLHYLRRQTLGEYFLIGEVRKLQDIQKFKKYT